MIKMLSVSKQIFYPGFSFMHMHTCAYGYYVPSSVPSERSCNYIFATFLSIADSYVNYLTGHPQSWAEYSL